MTRFERRLFAGCVLLAAVIVSRGSQAMSGPAPHYLALSHSLVRDADLDLRNQYAPDAEYLFRDATTAGGDLAKSGRNGGLYLADGLGFSALMAPAFAVVERVTAAVPASLLQSVRWNRERATRDVLSLLMAVCIGWTSVFTWRLTVSLAGPGLPSMLMAVSAFVTPPLLGLSFAVLPQAPAALVCAWFATEQLRPTRRARLSALALALLPWLQARYVILTVAGLMWMWRLSRRADRSGTGDPPTSSDPVGAAVLCGASVGALLVWRLAVFGTAVPELPVDAGWMTLAAIVTGLPGLLVDPDFGLLWVAPFWILAVIGAPGVRRAAPAYTRRPRASGGQCCRCSCRSRRADSARWPFQAGVGSRM
jgi:hypothetical protein